MEYFIYVIKRMFHICQYSVSLHKIKYIIIECTRINEKRIRKSLLMIVKLEVDITVFAKLQVSYRQIGHYSN